MTRTGYPTRRGYTLVELLVVMSLMILLAALAVGVSYSGMVGSQKVISGADRASGWLLIAKQRALRDGAPRGVRFFLSAATAPATGFVSTEAQYIEQPDVWVPNPAQEGNPGGARIVFVYQYNNVPSGTSQGNALRSLDLYYITGTPSTPTSPVPNDITEFTNRVFVGDSLILPEFGASFLVTGITVPTTPLTVGAALGQNPNTFVIPTANCRKITLTTSPSATTLSTLLLTMPNLGAAGTPDPTTISPPLSQPPIGTPITMVTYKFAFQGAPQLLLGEPVLQLSSGVAIDYRVGTTAAALGQPVDANGYRTWDTAPTTTGPYNPPTTIGVTPVPATVDPSGPYFDIVFAPSGQVLNNANSLICLWVRDPEKVSHPRQNSTANCDPRAVFDDAGEQALVVVSVKSGLINTQPVNPPPAAPTVGHDPYIFARDGLSSGL